MKFPNESVKKLWLSYIARLYAERKPVRTKPNETMETKYDQNA